MGLACNGAGSSFYIKKMQNIAINGCMFEELAKIENNSIDFICVDLPYGTTDCEWDKKIDLTQLKTEFYRIAKHNATICLFAQKKFTIDILYNFQDSYRYKWTWIKDKSAGFQTAPYMPLANTEDVLIFNRSGYLKAWNDKNPNSKGIYNPQWLPGEGKTDKRLGILQKKSNSGHLDLISKRYSIKGTHAIRVNDSSQKRYPKDYIYFPVPYGNKRIHPTQKPIELIEYMILTYTNEGATVLDCAAGSMTTAIACLKTNRNYIVIEKDANYYQAGIKRINEYLDYKKTLLF